jgi:hypothetical protein
MSVPHVSPATESHDRPSRSFAGRPGSTRSTTAAIVTSSTIATTKIAYSILPKITARFTARKPVTLPRICMSPTIALANPTCLSATRSGTYP